MKNNLVKEPFKKKKNVVLGQLGIYMQKDEVGPIPHTLF